MNFYKSTLCNPNSIKNGNIVLETNQNGDLYYVNLNDEIVYFQPYNIEVSEQIPNNIIWSLPTLVDDILFFENEDHLFSFQDLVNDYLSGFSTEIQEIQMNKIMSNFHEFYSFNNFLIENFDTPNKEFSNDEILNLSNIDFINDFVLKNLLNSHKTIGVSDKIYSWHSLDLIFSSDTSFLNETKSLIYSYINDNQLDPLFAGSLIFKNENIEYISKENIKKSRQKAILILDVAGQSLRYQTIIEQKNVIENCNKFKKGLSVELWEEVTIQVPNDPNNPNFGTHPEIDYHQYQQYFTVKVDWGDGSSIQTYYNCLLVKYIEHEYTIEGVFHPKVTTTFTTLTNNICSMYDGLNAPLYSSCSNLPVTPIPIEFATDISCTDADFSYSESKELSGWKLEAKIWVNHNVFGHHVGSFTHSWKYSNNKWKRKKADIYTNINANFRNDLCVVTETKFGSDTENQERVRVVKSKINKKYKYMGNDSITSEHHLTKDNIVINLELILTPCQ
jgi:hypothetical protein